MARARSRHRRKRIALFLFCAFAAAALIAAYRFVLDGERLRRFFESSVAHYTGIEMHLDSVEVTLAPARVVARGLRLSVPDATATADRVEVNLDLRRLLSREVAITAGVIEGLVVHLPQGSDAILEIIDRVERRVNEHRSASGPGAVSVSIAEIAAAAQVYFGDGPAPFAACGLRVEDLLSARIGVHAEAALRAWGEGARLYGDVTLLRAEAGASWQAEGHARLSGVQTERLPLRNSPEAVFAAELAFTPTDAGPGAEMRGRLEAPGRPEISGDIGARAVWTGERVDVQRLVWEASGARIEGRGAIASARDWSVDLRDAHASGAALEALLALAEQPRARFQADPGAQAALADVVVDSLDGEWRVDGGRLEFSGLTVLSTIDGPARAGLAQATRGLRGVVSADGGVVTLREIRSDDLRIDGTLAPDRATNTLHVDLRGEADLSRLPWTLLNERGDLDRIEGRLAVTRFSGTFAEGAGVPDNFAVEAELRDAAIGYREGDLRVDLRGVRGRFATAGKRVTTELHATDVSGAPLRIAGTYDAAAGAWDGILEGDPRSAVPALFDRSAYLRELRALSDSVGASTFGIEVVFPSDSPDPVLATFTRRDDGGAALAGRIEMNGGLSVLSVEATLPAQRIFEEYFPRLRGDGVVGAAFGYDGKKKTYDLRVDATACAIGSESIVGKPAGAGLVLRAGGHAGPGWTLDHAEITARGAPLLTTTAPARDGFVSFDVHLAALPALLPEGASGAGTVRGRLAMGGGEGELEFVDAALALDATVALDRVQGRVAFAPDSFRCEDLQLHGARSDCSLSLARQAGRWQGRATGLRLDVEAVTEFTDAVRALRPREESAGPRGLWTRPLLGEFALDLGELYYRRGRLDAVHFRVLGEERAIRLTEFSARQGEGALLGSLVILPGEATDAVVKSAAKWTRFDARALNDMVFPADRGFFGIFDGELTFDAPLGTAKEMMAAGSGSARFTGTKGSLGQIGFASKLLTVLKATEIINLRAPTLRDKGLVFNTLRGGLALRAGRMTLEGVALDGGAYAINTKGAVDFASDATDVDAYVRVLESVGRIIRKVPLLGDLATALSTDLIGVPVHFGGSPYDVHVGVAMATGKSVATTPLRAGTGAVKAVGEGFKRLIPGGEGKNGELPK